MDPQIMDGLKISMMYHLTRFLAGGINPPAPIEFMKMEDRESLIKSYGGDMTSMQTVGVIINRFSGGDSIVSRQFERDNLEVVEQALKKVCAVQEFKDFFSWYVDIRASDGFPECRRKAEECGLYIESSPGKDKMSAELGGLGNLDLSDNPASRSSSKGKGNGNGCLIPIAFIGSSLIATLVCLIALITASAT